MMFKSMDPARVWIILALVCMISTFLNWYITLKVFPDILDDVQDKWDEKDEIIFFYQLYMPTYCRISPYLFGMFVAYHHLADVKNIAQGSLDHKAFLISW